MTPDPVAIVRGALGKPMLSKEDCLAVWIAVLEGVREREPTQAMLHASEAFACGSCAEDVAADFRAMIDALLAEIRG